jgi:hypothetical protein
MAAASRAAVAAAKH